MALRETGKHYLMLGYAVIRQTLLEIGRRLSALGEANFLSSLAGNARCAVHQRLRRSVPTTNGGDGRLLTLEMPTVLFSDDLEAIGRVTEIEAFGPIYAARRSSAGVAEGTALGPGIVTLTMRHAGDGFIPGLPLDRSGLGAVIPTRSRSGDGNRGHPVARGNRGPRVQLAGRRGNRSGRAFTPRIRTGQAATRVDGNTGAVHLLD